MKNQLVLNGADVHDFSEPVFDYIIQCEVDNFDRFTDSISTLDGDIDEHIVLKTLLLESVLYGTCHCWFLPGFDSNDNYDFRASYEIVKKCIQIYFSECLEFDYKGLTMYGSFAGFNFSDENDIKVVIEIAGGEEFVLGVNDVTINM
jgi:hypothetical protein